MIYIKLIILISICITVNVCNEVGVPCDNIDNTPGICREAQKCAWAIEQLKNKKLKVTDFKRCGFSGNVIVICCKENFPPPPNNLFLRKAAQACEKVRNLKLVELANVDYHILGGEPTEPGEFPHQAALGYADVFDTNKIGYYCGGSLISKDFVLTAAHCVNSPSRQPKIVRLGKTSLDLDDDEPTDNFRAVDLGIKNVIIHPSYTSRRKYDDIALIQLSSSTYSYTKTLKPACMATGPLQPSQILIVTGWGTVDVDTKKAANWLLKANLHEVTLSDCRQKYLLTGLAKIPENLRETQMCATGKSLSGLTADACQGDSGGPLQIKFPLPNLNFYYSVVGITSFGASCGSDIPGVYTRVDKYLDWIESYVWPGAVEV